VLTVLVALGFAACNEEGGPGVYATRGTVEDVDHAGAQALVDHEDVPGLMRAMTMNFAVPDEEVLARLAPGQVIEFDLRFTGRSYEIESFEVVGEASFEEGWRRLGEVLVRTSPVPTFDLVDQAGRRMTDADLADRVWLVDFIYTECPGPCPIQTSSLVALQRALPERVRDRIHFVSISLDPEVDRPPVLEHYALDRGVDLARWSFLTGERAQVESLVRAWGVGSLRQADGTIDHTLILFAVKDGRVMDRYTLEDARGSRLAADLVTLADAPHAPVSGERERQRAGESASAAPAAPDHAHGSHGS